MSGDRDRVPRLASGERLLLPTPGRIIVLEVIEIAGAAFLTPAAGEDLFLAGAEGELLLHTVDRGWVAFAHVRDLKPLADVVEELVARLETEARP